MLKRVLDHLVAASSVAVFCDPYANLGISMPRYVILDCDGGSDDAWALLLLLKAEQTCDIKLLGITINGCGNTTLEHAASNMFRVLRACKREDVSIFAGATESLIHTFDQVKKSYFHGNDGFGDVFDANDLPPVESFLQEKHAVNALRDFCAEHPHEVTIFVVGPLTNLALSYSMYGTKFAKSIKEIFIMGGNQEGVGNSTRSAEFNFHSDPEAAYAVLGKSHCPITIVPWELCIEERFNIHIDWRLNDYGIRAGAHPCIELLNKVESAQWLPTHHTVWNPCDALLIAVFLFDKHFVVKDSHWNAVVELQGRYTRGQMVLDHLKDTTQYPENVRLIERVNVEFFKGVMEWAANLREDLLCD